MNEFVDEIRFRAERDKKARLSDVIYLLRLVEELQANLAQPVPMILTCPACNARHVDKGAFAGKPHHTHACQNCGLAWRPAIGPTVGVQFLPGFKDEVAT